MPAWFRSSACWLLAVSHWLAACGPATPTALAPHASPNPIGDRLWRGFREVRPEHVIRGFRGPVFTYRAAPQGAFWVPCPLAIPYSYQGITPLAVDVSLRTSSELVEAFPLNHDSLMVELNRGHPLNVKYVVVGRFVAEDVPLESVALLCPGATHVVRAIGVGAYSVVAGIAQPMGKADSNTSSWDSEQETRGRPVACIGNPPGEVLADCLHPLAFEFERLSLASSPAKSSPKVVQSSAPSVWNMPRSVSSTVSSIEWKACGSQAIPRGDSVAYLHDVASACGMAHGLSPYSESVSRWRSAGQAPSIHEVELEPGCYVAFATADVTVADVSIEWEHSADQEPIRDSNKGRWAIVPSQGPLCVNKRVQTSLRVSTDASAGAYALQLWRRPNAP